MQFWLNQCQFKLKLLFILLIQSIKGRQIGIPANPAVAYLLFTLYVFYMSNKMSALSSRLHVLQLHVQ